MVILYIHSFILFRYLFIHSFIQFISLFPRVCSSNLQVDATLWHGCMGTRVGCGYEVKECFAVLLNFVLSENADL